MASIVIQDTWTEPDDDELRAYVAGLDRHKSPTH